MPPHMTYSNTSYVSDRENPTAHRTSIPTGFFLFITKIDDSYHPMSNLLKIQAPVRIRAIKQHISLTCDS